MPFNFLKITSLRCAPLALTQTCSLIWKFSIAWWIISSGILKKRFDNESTMLCCPLFYGYWNAVTQASKWRGYPHSHRTDCLHNGLGSEKKNGNYGHNFVCINFAESMRFWKFFEWEIMNTSLLRIKQNIKIYISI